MPAVSKLIVPVLLSQFALASAAAVPPTGDQYRHYFFAEAQQTMPYRLYVPHTYDGSHPYPLLVVLHGGGADENQPFDDSQVRQLAEQRGVIAVAPLGYQRFGGYGTIYPGLIMKEAADRAPGVVKAPPGSPPARLADHPAAEDDVVDFLPSAIMDAKTGALSEKDVMNVIALVEKEYRVDDSRVYLMGNSMGGGGTQYLGVKYAEKFAALASQGSNVDVWAYPFERLRDNGVAILYVHGDRDEQAHYHWTELDYERARKLGVDTEFLLVRNGDHRHAWIMALPQTFDFLLRHQKR